MNIKLLRIYLLLFQKKKQLLTKDVKIEGFFGLPFLGYFIELAILFTYYLLSDIIIFFKFHLIIINIWKKCIFTWFMFGPLPAAIDAWRIGCNWGRKPFKTYALPPADLEPAAVRPRPRAIGRTPWPLLNEIKKRLTNLKETVLEFFFFYPEKLIFCLNYVH